MILLLRLSWLQRSKIHKSSLWALIFIVSHVHHAPLIDALIVIEDFSLGQGCISGAKEDQQVKKVGRTQGKIGGENEQ